MQQKKAATEGDTSATDANTTATAANANAVDDWIKKQWAAADAALALSGSQVGFERMLDTTAAATKKLADRETRIQTSLTSIRRPVRTRRTSWTRSPLPL